VTGRPDRIAWLARLVSTLLHPFAVLMALVLLVLWRQRTPDMAPLLAGLAVVIGVAWVFVLQRRHAGHWTTVDASRKRDRPVLYIVLLALLGGYWWWLQGRAAPHAGGVLAVGAMFLAAAVLNRWIKLSLHMASLAFAGIALLQVLPVAAFVAGALLPLLGWARLRMARHAMPEVLGGTLLGVVTGAVLPLA
jgi:hypothetical protein